MKGLHKNIFFPLSIIILLMYIVFILLLPIIGEQPEVFHDIILERVAIDGTNKSGEIRLFWSVLCSSVIGIILLLHFFSFKKDEVNNLSSNNLLVLNILIIPNIITLLFTGKFSFSLLALLLIFYIIREKQSMVNTINIMSLIPIIYYSFMGIIALMVVFFQKKIDINSFFVKIATIIILLSIYFWGKIKNNLLFNIQKTCGIFQIFIPLLLSIAFIEKYIYKNKIYAVNLPCPYKFIMGGILVSLVFYAIYCCFRKRNKIIYESTVISICIFVSFYTPNMIIPDDWHHSGEQIIAWNQIFNLNQDLYNDYAPVSGLYPLFTGFFKNFILSGNISDYNASFSLAFSFICIMTSIMLCYITGTKLALFLVIIFPLSTYSRQWLVLPSILFLIWSKILKNPGRWIGCWIWIIFLNGLYYPLYGMGLLIGTLPVGIYQCIKYVKNIKVKKKNIRILLGVWMICLIPIVFCIPLLYKMALNILNYSSQTILADGISIFGQPLPSGFLPYITHEEIRTILYYATRLSLPIIGVLLYVGIIYYLIRNWKKNIGIQPVLGLLSGLTILLIAYTYSMVRKDEYALLMRTGPIFIIIISFLLTIILYKYGHQFLNKSSQAILMGLSLGLGILLQVNINDTVSLPNNAVVLCDGMEKIKPNYIVSDEYELIDEQTKNLIPNIGNGFIRSDQKILLQTDASILNEIDSKNSLYLFQLGGQLEYEFLKRKVPFAALPTTARSYDTQQEIINILEKYPNIARTIYAWDNYYIYYWLMQNGYSYCIEYGYSASESEYEDIFNIKYPSELNYQNVVYDNIDYGYEYTNIANSLGRSMDSLYPIFEIYSNKETEINLDSNTPIVEIKFDKAIAGKDADFLYLDLDSTYNLEKDFTKSLKEYFTPNEKGKKIQVIVSWKGKDNIARNMTFNIGHGKLLIPLGVNPDWLLNEHNEISIGINFVDESLSNEKITINNVKFLKLKQER